MADQHLHTLCRDWDAVRIDVDTSTGTVSFSEDEEHVFKSMVRPVQCSGQAHEQQERGA